MLRYCRSSSSLLKFYNTLENLFSDSNNIDLVLSDFNIDLLNSTNINLKYVLSNYKLQVNEATDMSVP